MKLDHERRMYPPKVAITTKDLSSVQNIRVMFSNLKENNDLDMDVTLCQGIILHSCQCYDKRIQDNIIII